MSVKVQYAVARAGLPVPQLITRWVTAALRQARPAHVKKLEITVRIVGEKEITDLNHRYRHQDGPTNVLSFGYDIPSATNIPLIGDIVICAPVAAQEAITQGKEREAHWAHLIVHGTLHLLGFDHEDTAEATIMETLEIQILALVGYPDPYYEIDTTNLCFEDSPEMR